MTIRTEWHVSNAQLTAALERATARKVWRLERTSGLYAYVTWSDGKQETVRDGQTL
jgi:hypothetical protein